uniref:25S rRNA (uridine-N(3))-methyltransferase BMT5-like domain-containing protein n=1 Tax=Hordeum vulgare subsp. vulgare TaxID=112509 RepID=A0A8I6XRB6_HORVV
MARLRRRERGRGRGRGLSVRWLNHYSSGQSILIVGDGDFSFSLALAAAFGTGRNIVATSLDSYEALTRKYIKAHSNVVKLKNMGTKVLHGIDAETMKGHNYLKMRLFDRIVFNFPHAGFSGRECEMHVIRSHRELVKGFFVNARELLQPYGEIHISNKTGHPYDRWDIEELASESSLAITGMVSFQKQDYPGYNPKRGSGAKSNKPFPLGDCSTYKFIAKRNDAQEECACYC